MLADQSFAFEVGATIAEMRGILTTYDVDQKDIVIHPVKNPLKKATLRQIRWDWN